VFKFPLYGLHFLIIGVRLRHPALQLYWAVETLSPSNDVVERGFSRFGAVEPAQLVELVVSPLTTDGNDRPGP
jgi:hypothetical protein